MLLLSAVFGSGGGLVVWKQSSREEQAAAAAAQPEPLESIRTATAVERRHVATTTAIGTVLALRSITLRNELPGTVREVSLPTGGIVEEGAVLVALDVEVERAQLRALQAQERLSETLLGRIRRARENDGASAADLDRAQAERDVARAEVQRLEALIERKTLRAPFRARVGLSDVHVGQYLGEGTALTTLQSVEDAVHVDFRVAQDVAARLRPGDSLSVRSGPGLERPATITAVDARVDPLTRNAMVRARLDAIADAPRPAPGASVRVLVPAAEPRPRVVVPVSALRKGPEGDHVFVLDPQAEVPRAQRRRVHSGPVLGEEVVILSGLEAGEQVATKGSFKLVEGMAVAVVEPAPTSGPGPSSAVAEG